MFDFGSIILGFARMVKKFTCINIEISVLSEEEDLRAGVVVLPVLGLAIGFFACFISSFRFFYDSYFISILVLAYYCIMTGTKTLTDTYGTLNYMIKPRNQNEQIGGIIGIVIICMIYTSLFRLVSYKTILMMPVAGFSGLIILSNIFDRDKTNTTIMKYCGRYETIAALAISFTVATAVDYRLVAPLAVTYMILALVINIIDAKMKIIPSSSEGFLVEIVQIAFLTVTYIFKIT